MTRNLVLLKASLDSVPIFWFNIFKIPNTVLSRLERVRRNFLWGTKKVNGIERMHLLSWEKVCAPKAEGGLDLNLL